MLSRSVRRMSQDQLAKRSGIRPNQISRYETGAVVPQITQLEKLLDGLGIGYVEFFYVVSVIERLGRVFATCDRRMPPEAHAIHAALARLAETADMHLEIAAGIESIFGQVE